MLAPQKYPYEPDDVLGGSPYRIVRVVGAGGSAVAYEAEDTSCGRRVVVKVVRPDVARRAHFTAAQLDREVRLLVALARETEHVVEVVTAGVTSDARRLPYYVMELLEGQTLRVAFDRKAAASASLAIDEVIGIAVDLGVALEHAHRLGITHLDVKPENAFVHKKRDGSLVMKLLDFGISSKIDETLGSFRGTYRYAAPEQIRGQRVSPATDLYALGLVAFEALALRRPFESPGQPTTNEAIAHAQCEVPAPGVEQFRPDAPPGLVELIGQCLEKQPERRPRSAPYVVARLREIRRDFERRLVGSTGAPRSYLDTLTLVDPLKFTFVADSLRPRGAATAPQRPTELQGAPPPNSPVGQRSPLAGTEPGAASEVFLTAQPVWHSPAGGTAESSLSPAGVPRAGANRAVILSGVLGIAGAVAVAGVVLAVMGRAPASTDGVSSAHAAPGSNSVSHAVDAPKPADADPGRAALPEEATLPAPAPAPERPRKQHPSGAGGGAGSESTRAAAVGSPPASSRPAPPTAATTGITTQKDWF